MAGPVDHTTAVMHQTRRTGFRPSGARFENLRSIKPPRHRHPQLDPGSRSSQTRQLWLRPCIRTAREDSSGQSSNRDLVRDIRTVSANPSPAIGASGIRRTVGLDVVRALAIALVLCNHALMYLFMGFGHGLGTKFSVWFPLIAFLSVEWLFVLSGFLIGNMMIRSFDAGGTFWHKARSFWLRRWFRTVPTYYLFLVVNVILVVKRMGLGRPRWSHWYFAQNLYRPETKLGRPFFFVEAWSLALDEWFYLVMPLLLGLAMWLAKLRTRNAFLTATGALILLPTLLRLGAGIVPGLAAVPHDIVHWDLDIRRVTIYHLDATGWGVLAAVVGRWFPRAWAWRPGAKAMVGFLVMLTGFRMYSNLSPQAHVEALDPVGHALLQRVPHVVNAASLGFVSLGTFLMLPWIAAAKVSNVPLRRAVEWVSIYSYTIYLAHMPVIYIVAAVLVAYDHVELTTMVLTVPVWLLLTVLVSMSVYHGFEKPISDLRERFTRRVDANPFSAKQPTPAK